MGHILTIFKIAEDDGDGEILVAYEVRDSEGRHCHDAEKLDACVSWCFAVIESPGNDFKAIALDVESFSTNSL